MWENGSPAEEILFKEATPSSRAYRPRAKNKKSTPLGTFILPPQLPHLGELINLLQPLLDLQASPVARDSVHHGHDGLFDHLPADEALQDLGDLQAATRIPHTELLHLGRVRANIRVIRSRENILLGASPNIKDSDP